MAPTYREILDQRLPEPADRRWDVRSRLRHFALINYALPRERLERHIPMDRFSIPEFTIDGRPQALVSAVPFLDWDFHFIRWPWPTWRFAQTNYRAYVVDKASGQHCVWFFGTTLGAALVQVPRSLWRLPWHRARYTLDCRYSPAEQRYTTYRMAVRSRWGSARIDLADSGRLFECASGFASLDEMRLILTHPIDGYFYRRDGQLGTYSVWHTAIQATIGQANDLYFGVFEDLGLLSKDEMQRPHSVLICPETEFKVLLPPRILR
ncbi:MAG: DUF2071 domain-containing protein [Herpetosiphonaceae bacterium]|nr:DUF2071 domain-containing protein [Herpetosiphonaceae bacterium]